ncbi:MAG: hypothetical protein U5L98_18575 [Halomonas sp.]|nr:hypothetical protein [Halomonas sp.]MDZ7854571.1 hypothetical protein [Halomonas sp.]
MGYGPVPASKKALKTAGLTTDDIQTRGAERGLRRPVAAGAEGPGPAG